MSKPDPKPSEKPQDWSEAMKGATPEAVAWSLLQPVTPRKPPKSKGQ